jgi:hypothetical protein
VQPDSWLFFAGFAIGLGIAILGGFVDYWLSRRNSNQQQERQVPGCMLYVAGILGLAGAIALIISLIAYGGIGPAVILGAGVLGGFYTGFSLLLMTYFLIFKYWSR